MAISSRYRHQVRHVLAKKLWLRFKHWIYLRLRCGNTNRIAPELPQTYDISVDLE